MGLELFTARRDHAGYQQLRGNDDGEKPAAVADGRWVRRTSSWRRLRRRKAVLYYRMSRRRASGGMKIIKVGLLMLLVPARRAALLVAELARRIAECPAIVFSSQWGLPVLSHPASVGGRTAQLRDFYLHRSLSNAGTTIH